MIIINDIVYINPKLLATRKGYKTQSINMYSIKMYAIFLKNLSEAFSIFFISCVSLLAIGLYKTALTTGPKPDSKRVIYAKDVIINNSNAQDIIDELSTIFK